MNKMVPKIDYKILTVQPDPTKDFKIRVIDPYTKLEDEQIGAKIQIYIDQLRSRDQHKEP